MELSNLDFPSFVRVFIIAIVAIIIIVDIFLYFNDKENDTISNTIRDWVHDDGHYFIILSWGILGGHFFLGTYLFIGAIPTYLSVLIAIISIFIAYLFFQKKDIKIGLFGQISILAVGVIIGHFFWSLTI